MQELVLSRDEAGQRLDKYLRRYLNGAPPSFIYKMLRKKNITLNGKKAGGSELTSEGDIIKLFLSDETIARFRSTSEKEVRTVSRELTPGIIFEDRHLLIVNKPAGLLSQPDISNEAALTDWVRQYEDAKPGTREKTTSFTPAPLNRLDRNTSGIVLCGVSLQGERWLAEMIRRGCVRKEYLAVTAGGDLKDGLYRAFGKKDSGTNRLYVTDQTGEAYSELLTEVETLSVKNGLALRRINLITGKPHQIRAHLSFLGKPVAGDVKYGDQDLNRYLKEKYGIRRQLLHAFRVSFHPEGTAKDNDGLSAVYGGRVFEAPVPSDMESLVSTLFRDADV